MKIEHREVIAAPIDEVWALCADPVSLTRFTGSHMQVVAQEPGRKPELDARYRVLMQVGGATIGGSVIVTEYGCVCQRKSSACNAPAFPTLLPK